MLTFDAGRPLLALSARMTARTPRPLSGSKLTLSGRGGIDAHDPYQNSGKIEEESQTSTQTGLPARLIALDLGNAIVKAARFRRGAGPEIGALPSD